jgi:mannose-6-phosphate isomerase-like protein (cupin superfamily)
MRSLVICAVSVLIGVGAFAQTANAPKAPTDRAMDVKDTDLDTAVTELIASKLITKRMIEGGTFSVNVRHISGAETALSHGKITEVWVVRDGSGIVATGGTLVEPKPGNVSGEFSGTSIKGGVERTIKAGDLVFIPPGVPHGMKETASITYLNIRFETK